MEAFTTVYRWIVAWVVFLAVIALLNKTKAGHVFIYYSLLLLIFFLLVTQKDWIATALSPFQQLPTAIQGGTTNGGS